ncbi:hypothetical protein LQW54_010882 [Pestalotiopsis sp. IQ-011]
MNSPSAEQKTLSPTRPILGSLNEICIVTPHLYKTLDNLTSLGLGPFRVFDFNSDSVPEQELRGQKGNDLYTMLVAFAENPNPREPVLEVIQPLTGQTLMQEYLDRHNNQEGVQHIAFDMDDLTMDDRLERMAARGVRPAMQGVWKGRKGVTRFCFFDTVEQGMATCFETIAPSHDWQEPECRWYPATPSSTEPVRREDPKKSALSAYAGGLEELLQ